MENLLHDLFYGWDAPLQNGHPDTEEYKKASRETTLILQKLRDSLSPEQKVLLEQATDKMERESTLEMAYRYAQGVCFGARLTMEIWCMAERDQGERSDCK